MGLQDGVSVPDGVSLRRGFNLRNRRVVLVGLAVVAVLLFSVGILAGYLSRNDRICKNGKPPISQNSEPIGPTLYLCSNGQVVTK
jgi:hypothetical protein